MLRAAEVLLSLSVNCAENGLLDAGVGCSDMSAVASETIDPVLPNLGVVDMKANAAEWKGIRWTVAIFFQERRQRGLPYISSSPGCTHQERKAAQSLTQRGTVEITWIP